MDNTGKIANQRNIVGSKVLNNLCSTTTIDYSYITMAIRSIKSNIKSSQRLRFLENNIYIQHRLIIIMILRKSYT